MYQKTIQIHGLLQLKIILKIRIKTIRRYIKHFKKVIKAEEVTIKKYAYFTKTDFELNL